MKFQKPELEIITIEQEDIITNSPCSGAPTQMGDVYGSGCNFDPNAPGD